MAVTLKDIAERAGVDRSTVSLALNDATVGKLSPERVREIREISRQLGYTPNIAARQLRNRRTHCIGVVMNYLEYYPYSHYFNLISECCQDRGYHAVPLPMKHRDGRPLDEVELLENTAVDGLIVLEYDSALEGYFRERSKAQGPVVFRVTDPDASMLDSHHHIKADCAAGLAKMIAQIVERGWEHFYLIVERDADRPNPFVDEHGLLPYEAKGIAAAVRETGIELPFKDRVISCPARWAKSRYETVSAFLQGHKLQPGTCLLQCGADGISGTYSAIANAELQVGVDIAVAATNPTPPWEYVLPLTTACFELHEFSGRWLVGTAIDLIESKPSQRNDIRHKVSEHRIAMTDSTAARV